jgi:hypothetical protein
MRKKLLRWLGKLQIIRVGSYSVKGDAKKIIDAEIESKHSSSGFYGDMEEKMQEKKSHK